MFKRTICLLLVIGVCTLGCGCWDYRSLNELSFVAGMAVDRNEQSGDYIVTYEMMDLSGNTKQEGLHAKIVESTGRTISEAIRNANRRVTSLMYFGHSTVLVVSEQLMLDGEIEKILDWIVRDAEMRETANIIVSVGQPAGDLLRLIGLDQSVVSNEMDKILKQDHRTASLSYQVAAYEAYNLLNAEGLDLVLPIFHEAVNDEEKVVETSGVAVFKDNFMVGILSPLETKMLLFMIDKVHGGVLTCPLSEGSGDYFTLDVLKSSTELSYEVGEDGRVTFCVKVRINTFLSETAETANLLNETTIKKYETFAQMEVNKSIEKTAKRVQQEYGADIFGFGNYIHDTDAHLWEQLKDNWEDYFRNAIIVADTEISIANTEYVKS